MSIIQDMRAALAAASAPVGWRIGQGAWNALNEDLAHDGNATAADPRGNPVTLLGYPVERVTAFEGWELMTVQPAKPTLSRKRSRP